MAETLKLVLAPSQMVTLVGELVTTGAVFTVRLAAAEVAAGVQVPDTMHWYWYPLIEAVTELRLKVVEFALEISFHPEPVLFCHW